MTTVFVYGSLKRGFELAYLLDDQTFLGNAHTVPAYRLVSLEGGDYPGLFQPAENGLSVSGELWSVTPECLAELDRVEGVAEGLYSRDPIGLLPPHDSVPAHAYFYLGTTADKPDAGAHW